MTPTSESSELEHLGISEKINYFFLLSYYLPPYFRRIGRKMNVYLSRGFNYNFTQFHQVGLYMQFNVFGTCFARRWGWEKQEENGKKELKLLFTDVSEKSIHL